MVGLYGIGLGHEGELSEKTNYNIELLSRHELFINETGKSFLYEFDLNMVNSLALTFAKKLSNTTTIFAGPVLNLSVQQRNNVNPIYDLAPSWAFYQKDYNNSKQTRLNFWVGYKAGISF